MSELPHSLEVERAVLATCLDGRHKDAVTTARERLTTMSWFARDHRIVWLAIEDLDDAGQRVDAMAVATYLGQWPFADAVERLRQAERDATGKWPAKAGSTYEDSALAAVGGFNGVTDLAASPAPAAGIARNVAMVADLAAKRRLILGLTAVIDRARKTPHPAADVAAEAVEIGAAIEGHRVDRTLGAAGEALLVEHDRLASAPDAERVPLWGIPVLDRSMPLRRGLTVLAAPPGTGKTSLALEVEEATAKALGPGSVAYLSLEMDAEQLAAVRVARALGIGRDLIERGRLSTGQRARAAEAVAAMVADQTRIRDGVGDHTARGVAAWVRRLRQRCPQLALVIVDHLQLLDSTNPKQTEYQRLSEATAGLKRLQRELGLTILCLSQFNRGGQKTGKDDDKRQPVPQLSDLRGSGTIEQDADNVVALQKPAEDGAGGSIAIVAHVLKHRGGAVGSVDLTWHRHRGQRFVGSEPIAQDTSRMERMTGEPACHEDAFA